MASSKQKIPFRIDQHGKSSFSQFALVTKIAEFGQAVYCHKRICVMIVCRGTKYCCSLQTGKLPKTKRT